MALATIADLEARLGRTITDETELAQAEAFLADASALVSAYTRQTFTLVEDDEVVLRPVGTYLRLPQRPVRAVSSVVAVGTEGLADFSLAGWGWDGADIIDVAGIDFDVFVSLPGWWDDGGASGTYRVTYDHGYDTVPAAVIAVVCAMVLRVITSPSPVEGLSYERIGQYGYGFGASAGGTAGLAVRLTDADREALAEAGFRRAATTIAVKVR